MCKIRGRRARGPMSKGIYLARPRYDAGGYKKRGTNPGSRWLRSLAWVSSANAFSPLSKCLRCSQRRTTTFLPNYEGELDRGWAVSTLDLIREPLNDRLLYLAKGLKVRITDRPTNRRSAPSIFFFVCDTACRGQSLIFKLPNDFVACQMRFYF